MAEASRLGREQIETSWTLKRITDAGAAVWYYLDDRRAAMDSALAKVMASLSRFASESERERARRRCGLRSSGERAYQTRQRGELSRIGPWGDWAGRAASLHAPTDGRRRIDDNVRGPQPDTFTLHIEASGTIQCWNFLPNGRLRHPMWMGWVTRPRSPPTPSSVPQHLLLGSWRGSRWKWAPDQAP
jgi:hypothetical protein